nr:ATP synthase F0 subunit 6 [Prionium serratum]
MLIPVFSLGPLFSFSFSLPPMYGFLQTSSNPMSAFFLFFFSIFSFLLSSCNGLSLSFFLFLFFCFFFFSLCSVIHSFLPISKVFPRSFRWFSQGRRLSQSPFSFREQSLFCRSMPMMAELINPISFLFEEGGSRKMDYLPHLQEIGRMSASMRMKDWNWQGSPLEQFAIHPIMMMNIGNFFFSFTNSSLFMLLTLSLVLLLLFLVTKKGGGKLVPNAWQSLVELLYDFVLNLVNEQIGGLSGKVKQKFFPCILVTFLFLLFCNLQGMIPFSFTVTSHFLITLSLSFSLFIGITLVGFQRHGLHFLSFLLPAGVPLPLAPFLVLLELISYCFRALSLGIRLFANMMAGHSLVKILSGFAWTMLLMQNLFYFIGDLGPFLIVLALTGLELGVAILQAYVFTILICIYLNDAINLH